MGTSSGAPGVITRQIDESQAIVGAPIGVGAMFGLTARGVPDKAVYVANWLAFVRVFGDMISGSYLAYCAKRALERGCALWVSRVTAHDDQNASKAVAASLQLQTAGGGISPATITGTVAGELVGGVRTWPFSNGDTLSIKVDVGSTDVATITGAAATKALTSAATFTLANGETILYRVGGSSEPVQTLTLSSSDFVDITNATVQEVFNVLARDFVGVRLSKSGNAITLSTEVKGSSARLEFTGGTALSALGLSVEVRVGSGSIADLLHVTATELDTLVQAATANAAGVSADAGGHAVVATVALGSGHSLQFVNGGANDAHAIAMLGIPDTSSHTGASNAPVNTLLVKAANPAANSGDLTVLDPGTWANGATGGLAVDTSPATVNAATRGKLIVKKGGLAVETWDEYSLDPADSRYLLKLLVGSKYVTAVDQGAKATVSTYVAALPAAGTSQSLSGGDDGLTGLAVTDYQGDSVAKTGLYAFSKAEMDASFIGSPGNTDRAFAVSLLAYCSTRQNMVAVLDWPLAVQTPQDAIDYRMATGIYAGGSAFDTSFGAAYGPWLKVTDTLPANKGNVKLVPPMGDIFALYAGASIDGEPTAAGPTAGPAAQITDVLGLSLDLDPEDDVGQLYSAGLNCLLNHPKYGVVCWGEKNLQAVPSDLDRVPTQRWAIYARASTKPVVEAVALFQPNDPIAWRRVVDKLNPFLRDEVRKRAITAFSVVNDESVNGPDEVAAHRQNPAILFQPDLHAEFITLSLVDVAQTTALK